MLRFANAISAGLTVLSLLALPAAAQDPAQSRLFQVQKSGVLKVGMTGDYQPMTFRDTQTREFVGHQVDIARELAKDLGVKVEFVPTDWKTMINGLVANKYDIAISGTSMSLARAKTVGMIASWGTNAFVPIVRKENADKYKSWDDLNQKSRKAGVTLGTTMEDFIRAELPQADMRRVEAPGSGWQEVLANRVDYTISTMIEASAIAKEHPELVLIFTDQARNALPMTFLTPIEDQIWIHFLNNWVYLKKTAGYFDGLNQKWGIVLKSQ
ncbi:MAG: hypothetical protein BGP06_11620 [Rhizobiales bacterium 65-9]|nr:transporter substrate-binding domain-containing protein [Hyphomicrobiales bacterium]OJY33943.1 MAG: hypothetical protein BGP06_11620 [Rhizobiales bacterium 65-9]